MTVTRNLKYLLVGLIMPLTINTAVADPKKSADIIRVATFNVSMEALNYIDHVRGQQPNLTGNELHNALASGHQQIKNIAEIIQRVNPDVLLLNEFDFTDDQGQNIQLFINNYLARPQQGQKALTFPYFVQKPVNTGVKTKYDTNGDNAITSPVDTYGFGYFPGHFGMALLSKYPVDEKAIRTFQYFKWQDMPNALKPIVPKTKHDFYSERVWQDFRLSSKSHWDIPLTINGQEVHILASHPTPPVFDGPEDRNGKRNHDEIRFWLDYISTNNHYIYDDNQKHGGIKANVPFIIMGDQNASSIEGDAINSSIKSLLSHTNIQDPMPESLGATQHSLDNVNAKNHTAYWRMRADYVLPSQFGWTVIDSGVFWPDKTQAEYRLIKDRKASSDHRLVWVDLQLRSTDNITQKQ